MKRISLSPGGSEERQDTAVLRAGRSGERSGTSRPLPGRPGERRALDDERRAEHGHRHDLRGFHRPLDAGEQRQGDESRQHHEGTKGSGLPS